MGTHLRTWGIAAMLGAVLVAAWTSADLTINRLAVTVGAAFVAGAVIARPRWIGLAVAVAFGAGVASWLRVEGIPAYVVVSSVGRWAAFALLGAVLGSLLAAGTRRAVTARQALVPRDVWPDPRRSSAP